MIRMGVSLSWRLVFNRILAIQLGTCHVALDYDLFAPLTRAP